MQNDKRLTTRLLNYWDKLLTDANILPRFEAIQPSALEDVWPQCMVLAVQPSPVDKKIYVCKLMGDKVTELTGEDLSGKMIKPNNVAFKGSHIIKKADETVKRKEPMYHEGKFVSDNQRIVKYRSSLLPFGKPDGEVTHLLIGLSWKSFS